MLAPRRWRLRCGCRWAEHRLRWCCLVLCVFEAVVCWGWCGVEIGMFAQVGSGLVHLDVSANGIGAVGAKVVPWL